MKFTFKVLFKNVMAGPLRRWVAQAEAPPKDEDSAVWRLEVVGSSEEAVMVGLHDLQELVNGACDVVPLLKVKVAAQQLIAAEKELEDARSKMLDARAAFETALKIAANSC